MIFNSRPAAQQSTSSGITKNAEGHSAHKQRCVAGDCGTVVKSRFYSRLNKIKKTQLTTLTSIVYGWLKVAVFFVTISLLINNLLPDPAPILEKKEKRKWIS